jgi:hypothetical protein
MTDFFSFLHILIPFLPQLLQIQILLQIYLEILPNYQNNAVTIAYSYIPPHTQYSTNFNQNLLNFTKIGSI